MRFLERLIILQTRQMYTYDVFLFEIKEKSGKGARFQPQYWNSSPWTLRSKCRTTAIAKMRNC